MQKRNKTIALTSLLTLALIVFIGVTYTFFTAITSGDEGSSITIQTADMNLLFTDAGELALNEALPGAYVTKNFEVKNIGDTNATYNIRWREITNEFINSELTLSLQCTAYNSSNVSQGSCGTLDDVVGTSNRGAILSGVEIPVGITHRYTITITFIETGENQNYNQGKIFTGSILIDTIEINVATLKGILLDENSNTLANTIIELHSDPISTITNSKGEFILEGIEYGNHELIIKDNNTEIARSNIVLEMTNSNTKVTDTTSIYWNETQKNVVKVKVETSTNTITKIYLDWGEIDTRCFKYDSTSTSITGYYCYQGNTYALPTITDVVIPSEINGIALKTIGTSAFRSIKLTSVIIPDSVTYIYNSAFYGNQLTSVVIPDSVTYIGNTAFSSNDLTSVIIPDSVTYIGASAFSGNQLTSVTIGNSVTSISSGAFEDNQLTSVTIPNSVKIIGSYAFRNNQLTSITIPNSVTTIGSNAFSGNKLTSVKVPDSVTSIGSQAFYNNQLTSVDYPGGITIGGAVFNNNPLEVEDPIMYYKNKDGTYDKSIIIGYIIDNTSSVIIPDTVKIIKDFAFSAQNLTNATIGNSVETIGTYAFANNQLTSVTIGNSVTTIEDSAFSGNKLTSVTIPDSVTSIGYQAFCNNQLTSVTIGNGVTTIGDFAFSGNKIASVTIGNSVTSIGYYAFQYNQLTSVIIPDSVTSIGDYAFRYNQLNSVTIPDSVTSIGKYAFESNNLTSVKIGSGVKTIGTNAFYKSKSSTYPSNPNLSKIEIDNVSGAISGSPWGTYDATITYLK